MTIKPATDPRALSSMLGSAIRIAQRMGIHDESSNRRQPALEAELRRRLWWSVVLFDARISEMTDFRLGLLLPTWDCKPPLNANDFDFRSEMKMAPEVHGMTSEALFTVVRAEFGDFTRQCSFHLEFINPALKSVARCHQRGTDGDELALLGQTIEEKYLRYCDPQNPLQFLTIWWARGQLAKTRFIKYLAECTIGTTERTDAQRDAGISYALSMLECDTKIMSSKLTKGYRWLIYLNFPFPAYVHIVHDLRKRPLSDHAHVAWKIMSENCAARFTDVDDRDKFMDKKENPFFKIFAGVVFQAWTAREAALRSMGEDTMEPPMIVTQIRDRMASIEKTEFEQRIQHGVGEELGEDNSDILHGTDAAASYQDFLDIDPSIFPSFQEQASMGLNWGWPTANFHPMMGNGW
jgi:hypothetical protein